MFETARKHGGDGAGRRGQSPAQARPGRQGSGMAAFLEAYGCVHKSQLGTGTLHCTAEGVSGGYYFFFGSFVFFVQREVAGWPADTVHERESPARRLGSAAAARQGPRPFRLHGGRGLRRFGWQRPWRTRTGLFVEACSTGGPGAGDFGLGGVGAAGHVALEQLLLRHRCGGHGVLAGRQRVLDTI